jgi:hypothetical protein
MTTKYHTHIELEVLPTYHQEPPTIAYGIDDVIIDQIVLNQSCVLKFNNDLLPGTHSVFVDFLNKSNADCVLDQGLDKFIVIGNITVNGICSPKFNWAATYKPKYPEPWHSQQTPPPPAVQQGISCLGWNGRWLLNFSTPVFTWIHQLESMGWIWPTD